MMFKRSLAILIAAMPLAIQTLAAQTWDLRVEYPLPKGQNLAGTLATGAMDTISGKLDTGKGAIFSANHRIIRLSPILKLDWGLEFSQFQADGKVINQTVLRDSKLKQYGAGIGANAQFWVPFTPVAGELGLIQRFQHYKFQTDGAPEQDKNISRTWMRVGLRCNLPLPLPLSPYIAASYQQPFSKDKPVRLDSVGDLAELMNAQGAGQEIERLWTFGAGVTF